MHLIWSCDVHVTSQSHVDAGRMLVDIISDLPRTFIQDDGDSCLADTLTQYCDFLRQLLAQFRYHNTSHASWLITEYVICRSWHQLQSTLDISNSDILNSAKLEASIWIKKNFWLLSQTIIWRWRPFYNRK